MCMFRCFTLYHVEMSFVCVIGVSDIDKGERCSARVIQGCHCSRETFKLGEASRGVQKKVSCGLYSILSSGTCLSNRQKLEGLPIGLGEIGSRFG